MFHSDADSRDAAKLGHKAYQAEESKQPPSDPHAEPAVRLQGFASEVVELGSTAEAECGAESIAAIEDRTGPEGVRPGRVDWPGPRIVCAITGHCLLSRLIASELRLHTNPDDEVGLKGDCVCTAPAYI